MNKVKGFFKRCKAKIAALTVAAMAAVSISVSAFAATAEAPSAGVDMSATLAAAGNQLTEQFGSMVTTIVPVIIGILGSGLVIFGIFALVKVAKKIFSKVAG